MKSRRVSARGVLAVVAATVLAGAGLIFVSEIPASAGDDCGAAPNWTPLASTPDGASCSLRDVLDNLASDGDTVTLEPGATYPVDFDECSSIDIHAAVTLNGNGATVLIDCLDPDSRAFDIEAPNVVIDNLIVTTSPGEGGGGAINVEDDGLIVRNSTIVNNVNCFQAGGGFSSIGNDFSIVNSTVTGNVAFVGGGIAGGIDGISEISLTNSTVSGNMAGVAGAGILIGEGFVNLVYTDVVSNLNFVDEPPACVELEERSQDAQDVWSQGGTPVTPANILIGNVGPFGDVGAQQVDSHLTTFASVIADPLNGVNCGVFVGGEEVDPLANTVSHGYNFSDDATCGLTGTGDRESAGDPQIGALASNGGPTQTRLPADTSPLIDGVPLDQCQADGAAGVTTDQRGITRPQQQGCDIGSVEVEAPAPEAAVEIIPTLTG
jgi:hypothetical protein